jgi:hypothetical protein
MCSRRRGDFSEVAAAHGFGGQYIRRQMHRHNQSNDHLHGLDNKIAWLAAQSNDDIADDGQQNHHLGD